MDVKPGYATTEWWTTLGAHLIALVALFHTASASSWAQAVIGIFVAVGPEIGAAVYTHSRSCLKAAVTTNLTLSATNTVQQLQDVIQRASASVPAATPAPAPPVPPAAVPATV